MNAIRRFGSAMIVPVLLFPFFGIIVGLATLFKNEQIMGALADPDHIWYQIWSLIEDTGWTVFTHMELVFVIGLPISLAKKASGRAVLSAVMAYLMFNTFISSIIELWAPAFNIDPTDETGMTEIAGIETLDTNILGAIVISGITIWLHNKYYDKKLPDALGIFQGGPFVVMLSFFVMLPLAFLTAWIWPMVQDGIASLQGFMIASGSLGVWLFHFLERILIPTGLHHFIYTPFQFGPAVVNDGITAAWVNNLSEFSTSSEPLAEQWNGGGFLLQGNIKMFGSIGIALAMYTTAKAAKKKQVGALLLAATLTAVVAGITEPLEFTFLFIAPLLFALHAFLGATMVTIQNAFGLVGNQGGGLIEIATTNWIPLAGNHWEVYLAQIVIGLIFTVIYFYLFRFLILKFDIALPGREKDDEGETKLYTKEDYKAQKGSGTSAAATYDNEYDQKAAAILEGLGGTDNIADITNCATRLRVTVVDPEQVADDQYFKDNSGAHGLVKSNESIQVIVGLSVPQVRDSIESFMNED
ncbi:PTS system maltose-specific IIB component (Glc family) /PTS system maltose-specific IIC component (Glc family) [Salsuginibacillus halophilus]|uniref:PTS system maltose-specific IIB component (Glc family) /PTS system maltose-specific IIC component (Glc family) n=1 Tax=Salsuginibacillus halophilus TaxID=517424 RepID=A0A2P8HE76_9BACI|nr:alpha-glucoside-specific PTS transporter subunit IIBC [Salsuginibacillus halophilus]PSL44505.1 PTS system maltose-specific IIB component (Glc family) /PTS system maltose-specific IIC component (Glc family) [Salsuginibacillus halophilus]